MNYLAASITGIIPCMGKPEGCNSWQDFFGAINALINYAFIIATILATISFTYAGWLYLTAAGSEENVKKAHKIFIKVVQGFIIMAVAYLLVQAILLGIAKSGYSLLQ